MNVLIAGCGYVGSELGRQLARAGHRVWGLRRHPEHLDPSILPLQADLLAPATLRALPGDLDAVVYAAAADASDATSYQAAYLTGLTHLLDALDEQGHSPQRVLYTSSTGVYGQSDGQWVDESSETQPARPASHHILDGERLLLSSRFPATVVRFSGIYGPARTRIIDWVRSGRALRQPGPSHWTNRIHRDDCAACLAHILALEAPDALYLASDSEPVLHDDFILWLAERLGVPPPAAADAPVAATRAPGQNKRCRNARLLASGFRFRYPTYREGYDTLIALSNGS